MLFGTVYASVYKPTSIPGNLKMYWCLQKLCLLYSVYYADQKSMSTQCILWYRFAGSLIHLGIVYVLVETSN